MSQTCSSWRQLLLDNGRFWNKLVNWGWHEGDEGHQEDRAPDRLVLLWLEGARDSPLRYDLDFGNPGSDSEEANILGGMKVLRALNRKQANSRSITLRIWDDDGRQARFVLHNVKNLVSLDIHHNLPFSWEQDAFDTQDFPLFIIPDSVHASEPLAYHHILLTGFAAEQARNGG